MANDGTLSIDSTKLSDALANRFANVQAFFQSAGSVTGFANNFSTDLTGLMDSTEGVMGTNLRENKSLQTLLTRQISDFEARLTVRQQELIKQYSRVDTMLRQFPLILSQITSQLAVLQNQGL